MSTCPGSGSVLWTSHPSVQRLPLAQYDEGSTTPSNAATSMTPSVDTAYGILLLRYDVNGNPTSTPATFQGFTSLGNDPSTGYISRTHSAADADADPRESEGMAIYTGSGAPRLCFSITSNSGSIRQFDLYYKV